MNSNSDGNRLLVKTPGQGCYSLRMYVGMDPSGYALSASSLVLVSTFGIHTRRKRQYTPNNGGSASAM